MKQQSRKIALNCKLAPGDTVVVSATTRDIQLNYPGMFEIMPMVSSLPLFKHNPYIVQGRYTTNRANACEQIEIASKLADYFKTSHIHKKHYIECVNEIVSKQIGLPITTTATKGDIYLSDKEKLTNGLPTKYWAITSGGKLHITVKLYPFYQKIIDILKGKITFVQIGKQSDFGPTLDGVINLQFNDLRQLSRIIYHSAGVVTPISCPMHLAGAFCKPAVVLAGGYEEPSWFQYENHKIISKIGMMSCCLKNACYKLHAKTPDRITGPSCDDIVTIDNEQYANCMANTDPEEVAQHILNITA